MKKNTKFPADFEKLVKTAPSSNGRGYPYQLSAKDLMSNFKFLLELLPEGATANDMLYWKSDKWELLPAAQGTGTFVLATVDGKLQWLATEECD